MEASMPTDNRISIQIPIAERTQILEAVDTIKRLLLPYLVALTPDERVTLPKVSEGTLPFVEKVAEYVKNVPHFNPPFLDKDELKIDLEAMKVLLEFYKPMERILNLLDDTILLCGSETYIPALSYYNSVKVASKMNIPEAKPIYQDLKERFAKSVNREKQIKPLGNN